MMTVTIKIENNNLDKAKVEVEALLVYINELDKTYPTTFKDHIEKVITKKPTRKPRTTKPKTEAEPVTEPKDEPTPVKEEKTVTAPSSDMGLKALTTLAKSVVAGGKREEAKALIAEYSTSGKLSSVPEDKYDELAEALKGLQC